MPHEIEENELVLALQERLVKQENTLNGLKKMRDSNDNGGQCEEFRSNPDLDSYIQEVNSALNTIKQELEMAADPQAWTRAVPSSPIPILTNWIHDQPFTLDRLEFLISQLRDKVTSEETLVKAMNTLITLTTTKKDDTAEDIAPVLGPLEWQLKLAETKVKFLQRRLKELDRYLPIDDFGLKKYPSSPISNCALEVQVKGIHLPEGDPNESLLVRIWIDHLMIGPMKLKRRPGSECEISISGIQVDLQQAQNMEIVVYNKGEDPKAFVFFHLSWLHDFLRGGTRFQETLDLVPSGNIRIEARMTPMTPALTKEGSGIRRRKAVKKKPFDVFGHQFRQETSPSVLMRCSHCTDTIVGLSYHRCTRCMMAAHERCCKDVFLPCFASTTYNDWEDMMTSLKSASQPHNYVEVMVGQTFCNHCGHAISFTKTCKCKVCSQVAHKECLFYAADLCKLDYKRAMDIVRPFLARERRSSMVAMRSESITPAPSTDLFGKQFKPADFDFIAVIGKGNFGKVMLAKYKNTGKNYALKILKKSSLLKNDELESLAAEREVFLMIKQQPCPFLVECHGIFQTETRIIFVMEFVGGGDLMFHIQKTRFSEDQARFFAAEVFLALEYLHRRNIIYRDLKLDNVLLDLTGHIKLADYGLCKLNMGSPSALTNTFCGTPEFMAPEIVEERPYGKAVDWWAFGVLLYELLFAKAPFSGRSEGEIFMSIRKGNVSFPPGASIHAIDLIKRDPEFRLGSGKSEEVKRHPFFASVNFDDLLKRKIDPPLKPNLTSPTDVSNFDPEFTQEAPVLTPIPTTSATTKNSPPNAYEEILNKLVGPIF